jgi:hypothetical protein
MEFQVSPLRWTAIKLRCLDAAEVADAWRVVPRMVLSGYGYLCWELACWYMSLKDPSAQQMAFVTIIVGLAVPLTNFYMNSGRVWK